MLKWIRLLMVLSVSAAAEFRTLDADAFEKMIKQGRLVIDIRTPQEWRQTGIIKGAKTMMFFAPTGEPLVAEWFFNLGQILKDKRKPILIYCAHANRTKILGEGLSQMGFKVYDLKDGIENGWIRKGKKTIPYRK